MYLNCILWCSCILFWGLVLLVSDRCSFIALVKIQIAGHDITSSLSEAFHVMGYCPQHDPLYSNITMREHLEAYALIKGIHPKDIKTVAEQ